MAYMGYVVLIKRVGPVKASTVVLIVPVSGMLWANLFLNEAITSTMLMGCLLIITGVGLVNFLKTRFPVKKTWIGIQHCDHRNPWPTSLNPKFS